MNLKSEAHFFIWIGSHKAHLRRFRLAAGILFCLRHALFRKACVSQCLSISDVFTVLLKTSNGRETQLHAEEWSKFVMHSHLDPIGDQNDVKQLPWGNLHVFFKCQLLFISVST